MYETPESCRWATCCHEAGHACAAMLLGFHNVGAVVFDDAEGGGICTTVNPSTAIRPPESYFAPPSMDERYRGMSWPELLRRATYAAAGCAGADLLIRPELMESVPTDADALEICAIARAAVPTSCDGLVEISFGYLAAARARALLEPVKERVRLVAHELDRRGRMTAEEVCAAMYPEHSKKT